MADDVPAESLYREIGQDPSDAAVSHRSCHNGFEDEHNQQISQYDYYQPSLEPIEVVAEHQRGGYHPVSLGNHRIVHKLGHGGQSTVWLARDSQTVRYVALKILCANASNEVGDIKILEYLKGKEVSHPGYQHIAFLLDHFRCDGPNECHICLVSEVLGPSISSLMAHCKQFRGSVSRVIARQFVQAVAYLHAAGVCHGDLTAANLALELEGFDSLSEDQLYLHLGKPRIENIRTESGKEVPATAPKYVVQPLSFLSIGTDWLRKSIRIIDFGIAFFRNDPPSDLGTPPSFTAPEAWLEMAAGESTDLWAMGCTLYSLRAAQTLIQLTWGGTPLEVVGEMISLLGPLPDRWDRLCFDEYGMPKERTNMTGDDTFPSWTKDTVERKKLPMELEIEANGGRVIFPHQKPKQKISLEEASDLADLLGKVLKWEPTERASAQALTDHPWFNGNYPDVQPAKNAPGLFQS
ncbi:MAG: hypothetical protein Q9222_002777 [Ikaeria aurantiellina]